MKFFTVLGIMFYAVIVVLIGLSCVVFALNILLPQDINSLLVYAQASSNTRVAIGLSGLLLILISFSFAQIILGKFQREKTIAFATSSGQVTISLSAVEDLIRRLAGVIPEVKELRPNVVASKKGIVVDMRIILRSEANIPDLTSRLQDLTKSKIQEILGLEEQVIIRIHVAKISHDEKDNRRRKEFDKEEPSGIPFSGYTRP
ncbi:MAG: alkaline shock response membrane anchor protein AmaP [Candidatus Omnitrophica bacterium]|nr:alkaline shock response membrane anchor protein AmaP [Candidatus Omnitrophota bacterium]MDD5042624.1 alkaline shock response membrane anchor protein AmaP [Candidatus Omnitrophota bacterium]MDD5500356.1 alkaline shock response membrane anchor protein AmaP [Candidatus Omnitrophota bacterium]